MSETPRSNDEDNDKKKESFEDTIFRWAQDTYTGKPEEFLRTPQSSLVTPQMITFLREHIPSSKDRSDEEVSKTIERVLRRRMEEEREKRKKNIILNFPFLLSIFVRKLFGHLRIF